MKQTTVTQTNALYVKASTTNEPLDWYTSALLLEKLWKKNQRWYAKSDYYKNLPSQPIRNFQHFALYLNHDHSVTDYRGKFHPEKWRASLYLDSKEWHLNFYPAVFELWPDETTPDFEFLEEVQFILFSSGAPFVDYTENYICDHTEETFCLTLDERGRKNMLSKRGRLANQKVISLFKRYAGNETMTNLGFELSLREREALKA